MSGASPRVRPVQQPLSAEESEVLEVVAFAGDDEETDAFAIEVALLGMGVSIVRAAIESLLEKDELVREEVKSSADEAGKIDIDEMAVFLKEQRKIWEAQDDRVLPRIEENSIIVPIFKLPSY